MRPDLDAIAGMVQPGQRVLDLGCGNGELLALLQTQKCILGYGLENDPDKLTQCLAKGVDVLEQDLDLGLGNFHTDSFDLVILAETLQAMRRPDLMLDEMLRIGRECIVTLPNMSHWSCRLHLLARGRMPVSRHLPYRWFDTPNIHLCSFADFEHLVADKKYHVVERVVTNTRRQKNLLTGLLPSLFGAFGLYRICKSEP